MNFSDETVSKVATSIRNGFMDGNDGETVAQAALSSLTLADLMPWQPIATAPKDGRSMLVYYKNCLGKDRIIKAMFIPKNWEESDGEWAEYNEEKDCYYTPEGWYECCDNWDEYSHFMISSKNVPTHWMPLPNPPTEAK